MPTYRTSARNQFRTPSGAVGDPPDGPGGMAALSDDIDNMLGVGGAEYCANAAAVAAIPAGRIFVGKMVYRADQDCIYRWVGVGNTNLRGNDTTHGWQAWFMPSKNFTPAWTNLTIGSSTVLAQYGIGAGVAWLEVNVVAGASFTFSAAADIQIAPPAGLVCGLGVGTGLYTKAGATGNNVQVDLATYPIGTTGQAASGVRIRAKYANAAPGAVTNNILGSVITPTTTDSLQFSLRSPAAGTT